MQVLLSNDAFLKQMDTFWMFNRIVVIGDNFGIPVLLDVIPPSKIVAVVISSLREMLSQPLKNRLLSLKIPLLVQPKFSSHDYFSFFKSLEELNPDCLFCNSYSMLIRKDVLQLVDYKAFNIHAAYLPYNRGPNPMQWAIINGDNFTGVTVHCMDEEVDAGDIVYQVKEPIYFDDTWVTLKERLSKLIVEIASKIIPNILLGNYAITPQNKCLATQNPRLTPHFPQIDFETMSDGYIYQLIRAQVKPLQGAYVRINGTNYYFNEFIPLERIADLRKQYSAC